MPREPFQWFFLIGGTESEMLGVAIREKPLKWLREGGAAALPQPKGRGEMRESVIKYLKLKPSRISGFEGAVVRSKLTLPKLKPSGVGGYEKPLLGQN